MSIRRQGFNLWINPRRGTIRDMNVQSLTEEIAALPESAQKVVADLISSLRQNYPVARRNPAASVEDWKSEPAFGMWRDRSEMEDSAAYVRELRAQDAKQRSKQNQPE